MCKFKLLVDDDFLVDFLTNFPEGNGDTGELDFGTLGLSVSCSKLLLPK